MTAFVIRALLAALGLWLASEIVPGVVFTNLGSLAAAAILLGLVNAVVRPVLVILTLPLTIVTLGLFLIVINAAMIGLVALFLKGFVVAGLVPAILCWIVVTVVSWIGSSLVPDRR
jgi:putative membrane protein